jgi:hypothetical protein
MGVAESIDETRKRRKLPGLSRMGEGWNTATRFLPTYLSLLTLQRTTSTVRPVASAVTTSLGTRNLECSMWLHQSNGRVPKQCHDSAETGWRVTGTRTKSDSENAFTGSKISIARYHTNCMQRSTARNPTGVSVRIFTFAMRPARSRKSTTRIRSHIGREALFTNKCILNLTDVQMYVSFWS